MTRRPLELGVDLGRELELLEEAQPLDVATFEARGRARREAARRRARRAEVAAWLAVVILMAACLYVAGHPWP